MTRKYPELYAEKNSLVKELFVSTADDNYTLARWCFHQNVNVDFFWLAVHSLEKYFKAVLLSTARRRSHLGTISKNYTRQYSRWLPNYSLPNSKNLRICRRECGAMNRSLISFADFTTTGRPTTATFCLGT
jgi:hypothetical protein